MLRCRATVLQIIWKVKETFPGDCSGKTEVVWLLVAGCWLLVAGCWLLVAGYLATKARLLKT